MLIITWICEFEVVYLEKLGFWMFDLGLFDSENYWMILKCFLGLFWARMVIEFDCLELLLIFGRIWCFWIVWPCGLDMEIMRFFC